MQSSRFELAQNLKVLEEWVVIDLEVEAESFLSQLVILEPALCPQKLPDAVLHEDSGTVANRSTNSAILVHGFPPSFIYSSTILLPMRCPLRHKSLTSFQAGGWLQSCSRR